MLDLGTLKIGVDVEASSAISDLGQLESSLDDAGKTGKGDFSSGMSAAGTAMEQTTSKVSTLQIAMGNLVAKGIAAVVNSIKNQLSDAVSRADTLNNYTKTMVSLGYAADDADVAIDTIASSIQNLPISLDEAAASQQRFVALLGDLDGGTDAYISIQNAAYAAGQGQESANRAIDAWYKTLAKGKPEAEQWQTLNETMPAQMNQIAESMLGAGAKSQDLFKAWQEGTVTSEDILAAMSRLNEEGGEGFESFASQAESANAGIKTSMDNIKLAITRNLANVLDVFGDDIKEGADGAVEAIDKVGKVLEVVAKVLQTISPILLPLLAAVGAFVAVIGAYSAALKVATAAQAAYNAVMAMNPVVLVVAGVIALIAALALLVKNWDKVKKLVAKGWKFVINSAPIQKAIALIEKIKEKWNNFKAAIKKGVKFVINHSGISLAIDAIKKVIEWWNKLKNKSKETITLKTKSSNSKDGSHRIGLKEVPYDGYISELHKGEAILTAAEANQYRRFLEGLDNSKTSTNSEVSTINNDNQTIYNIGDITLDVTSLKDIPTIEDFVTMITRVKAFA